jgi:putative lipoic acid-binding regulatory protein
MQGDHNLPEDPRERALLLLDTHHTFPGPFEFRVVVRPEGRAPALEALVAKVGADRVHPQSERPSAQGNYLAVRVKVEVAHAADVLDLYELIRAVPGVVTVL